jgi:hypothetical protein
VDHAARRARAGRLGRAGGSFFGWLTARPSGPDSGLRLAQEAIAFGVAAFVLVRVVRDIPAVGEAPPDDPELAHTTRVRRELGKLAVAGLLLAVTWLMLR